jgi:hypothetical protein
VLHGEISSGHVMAKHSIAHIRLFLNPVLYRTPPITDPS